MKIELHVIFWPLLNTTQAFCAGRGYLNRRFYAHTEHGPEKTTLTPNHRNNQMNLAALYRRWTRNQWAKVLFSDKSWLTLCLNEGRIRIWWHPWERYEDATIRKHDRFEGGSVMVQGGFSSNHRTPLHIINGRLTGLDYQDTILRLLVLPAVGNGAIFQDDNAPCNRDAAVKPFCSSRGSSGWTGQSGPPTSTP